VAGGEGIKIRETKLFRLVRLYAVSRGGNSFWAVRRRFSTHIGIFQMIGVEVPRQEFIRVTVKRLCWAIYRVRGLDTGYSGKNRRHRSE